MSKKIILLVEDNPDDEELILLTLKRNHVCNEVVVARDGAEALDYVFQRGKFSHLTHQDKPEVVLLDLKLPKVSGLEVLEEIRSNEETQLLPVVILTSSSEEEDIVSSYRLGANSYVRKPVEFQRFSEAVAQLGLYWLLINQPPPMLRP